jgi:hypothetical protein
VSDSLWDCPRRAELILRNWPDGTVVFDDASGQLQCLSPVSGSLMGLLVQPHPWSAMSLADELLGETPTADDVEMVENALAEFSTLNFIERVAV